MTRYLGAEEARLTEPDKYEMSVENKMQMWRNSLDQGLIQRTRSDACSRATQTGMVSDFSHDAPDFKQFAEVVFTDCSYTWLIARLRGRSLSTIDEDDDLEKVRRAILNALPETPDIQSGISSTFQANFEVSWPLRAFLVEQFPDTITPDIGRIMTITGNICDAQALTCAQYMEQTWPCTGVHLLHLLQKLVVSNTDTKHSCERPDGTNIKAWQLDVFSIGFETEGTRYIIAEIAEQLAWLSAALNMVPKYKDHEVAPARGFTVCTPSAYFTSRTRHSSLLWESAEGTTKSQFAMTAKSIRQTHGSVRREQAHDQQPTQFRFEIRTTTDVVPYFPTERSCWDQLVDRMILVGGFPIHRRETKSLGLEIPLKVAAELIGTNYINAFAGTIFVKGYSAMLVPVRKIKNIIVWHLVANSPGQHLSYFDHDLAKLERIDLDEVANFRHIVGWCTHASNYTGAADGYLAVRRANLPRATPGSVLAGGDISFGKRLESDFSFEIPKWLRTTHARTCGLSRMFRYLSRRSALLWDKLHERGWLVNGINALLHMVRTSLYLEEKDSVASLFVLKVSDLEEPKQPHSAKAAFEFFGELKNLQARVSIKRDRTSNLSDKAETQSTDCELLSERVEEYYHVLEKALTYSEKLKSLSTRVGKWQPAPQLEGWDFFDLANESTNVHACTIKMPNTVRSWLGLIRSIGAATLFASGFGDLIKPLSVTCCESWKTLPVGKHYVAVNVADLKKVMEFNGDIDAVPKYLGESLLWHNPRTAFEDCGCQEMGVSGTRLVQQPCSTREACSCSIPAQAGFDLDNYSAGAVIFGYNPAYGLPSPEQDEDDFEDSALGSSLTYAGSGDTDLASQSTTSVPPTQPDAASQSYRDGHVSGGYAHFGSHIQNITNNNIVYQTQVAQQMNPSAYLLGSPPSQNRGTIESESSQSASTTSLTVSTAQRPNHKSSEVEPSSSNSRKRRKISANSWKDTVLG